MRIKEEQSKVKAKVSFSPSMFLRNQITELLCDRGFPDQISMRNNAYDIFLLNDLQVYYNIVSIHEGNLSNAFYLAFTNNILLWQLLLK